MARWSSLTKKQKKKVGSKKNYKKTKKAIRSSGGNIQSARQVVKTYKKSNPTPAPAPAASSNSNDRKKKRRDRGTASKVNKIENYDTTSYGSGHKKGTDKISRADVKELFEQGFSKKKIVDYVEGKYASGTKGGNKAKSLLNQYKADIAAKKAPAAAAPVMCCAYTCC